MLLLFVREEALSPSPNIHSVDTNLQIYISSHSRSTQSHSFLQTWVGIRMSMLTYFYPSVVSTSHCVDSLLPSRIPGSRRGREEKRKSNTCTKASYWNLEVLSQRCIVTKKVALTESSQNEIYIYSTTSLNLIHADTDSRKYWFTQMITLFDLFSNKAIITIFGA